MSDELIRTFQGPLYDSLFNSSRTPICHSEGPMSLNVFLAFCILGIEFMIYAFFQWTYGDRRSALARRRAAHKNGLRERSQRACLAPLQKTPCGPQDLRSPASG